MRNYWERRAINQSLMGERSVLDYEKDLEQLYNVALVEIRKEIDAFFGKYAKKHIEDGEAPISYAEARKRLTSAELKDFQSLLRKWYESAKSNNMSAEYIQYLQVLGSRVYISRLEGLEASIRHEIEDLKTKQHKGIKELLTINYIASHYTSQQTISQGVSFPVSFTDVDKAGIETAMQTRWEGRNYSDSVWKDKDRLIHVINKIIPQSFSRGLNSNVLGDMIAKELNVSKNRGRTLARTEVNYLSNQADLKIYKQIRLTHYQYLATLDLRTSEICRGLDGLIEEVNQAKVGVNFPPMHPNCRSTTVPYFKDEEGEQRVARDQEGKTIKVPRSMTQEQWIKKFVDKDYQERLLSFVGKYYKN